MIKNLLTLLLMSLTWTSLDAQNFWTKKDESALPLRSSESRSIIPDKYDTYSLDVDKLKQHLKAAPMEFDHNRKSRELTLQIPMPDGKLHFFRVYESPVMEPGISARYPGIKSYKAYSVQDRTCHMRFTLSVNGFHASIINTEGEKYIDPYSSENDQDYIIYHVKDHNPDTFKGVPLCGMDEEEARLSSPNFRPVKRYAEEVELRVYRMAMACTGEWGARRGTVEKCLADMNTMMSRMNIIYEKEMAIRFVLIDQNDKLIFLNAATDPYDNSDQGKLLVGINTSKLNAIIPSNSYDIGHVLSVCFDIGGVAQRGSICQSNKGNGVTCNNDNNLASAVTRVMAHEVGHQLDASHTWNICTSAADQRAPTTAFEPGSGTTIMSYAGSCGTDNVANDNDDYFHVGSLDQMNAKTTLGGNAYACANKIASGNHFPVLTMPAANYVIPISTPFELGAKATDEDGDILTYCWEQYDAGELVTLGTQSVTAPLFRSFKPATNGDVRFFPRASNIISGAFSDKTEVLPTLSRTLNFRLTVRDNQAGAGGVVWEDYKISSTTQAGPFKITYPEIDARFKVGDAVTVTWDVANTDKAPVNCKLVNIYASFNGALRSDDANMIPLALNVPNDGSQVVYIPNRISNFMRVVIKAADNIFLTSSRLPSRIEQPTTPGIYFETSQNYVKICQPDLGRINFTTAGLAGYNDDITFELISGLPAGATASFSSPSVKAGNSITLNINTENVIGDQSGQIIVRAYAPNIDTMDRIINIDIEGGDLSGFRLIAPNDGASGVVSLPRFNWFTKSDADKYEIQVSRSPDFANQNIVTTREVADSTFTSTAILDKATIYYWRVRAKNSCKDGSWSPVHAFMTEALACKVYQSGVQSVNISASGTPRVELPIQIVNDGLASDVNVKLIRGEHSRLVDLVAYLVAPSGVEALLWNRKCGTQQNLNVGLDDQSPDFFQCPINTGKVYRPESPLSVFNNESIKGIWKLRLEDKQSGSGGRLQEFNLEICSNVTLDQPYLVRNDTLKIHPGNNSFITDALLLVADNNNTANELVYTLVDTPSEGTLTYNGNIITAGAKFTQAEINASKIKYSAIAGSNGLDYFTFTVTDNQGGWISITRFWIERNDNFINNSKDLIDTEDIILQPNPTNGDLIIHLTGKAGSFTKYTILDMSGREIKFGNITDAAAIIHLNQVSNGVYIIKFTDGKQVVSKKVVKI